MLPKKNRTDKKLVEQIFKEGKFVNSPNLTFKFIKKDTLLLQVAFIAPKTVSKRAVDRNLLRRRGYDAFKKYIHLFPLNVAGVFVFGKKSMEFFGGRKNKTKNPFQNLENEIQKILSKIN